MRQTLTNDFWGLHENMNCAFPLMTEFLKKSKNSNLGIYGLFLPKFGQKLLF